MPKTFETLLYSVEDRVATITLNRPDRMNAYTVQMMADLIAAFDETDADDNVRAVIVTGAGRAFCAGADLAAGSQTFGRLTENSGAGADEVPRDSAGRVTLRIFDSLKPVIAAVNGAAVGVGVTMQLPMDVRIASTEARFGMVFARRGITMEGASAWFLPHIVGPSVALEWCFSGRVFPAQEALERGLVHALYKPEELLPAARAMAREIAENSAPVSVTLTRQMIWRSMGERHPMHAHVYESRSLHARGKQQDRVEGVKSFLEKRPASFSETVPKDLPNIWRDFAVPEFDPKP
jgi:enoyl-CoA hydratase/carnithine racemase